MIENAATALMVLVLLNFVGVLVMFLFVLRGQDQMQLFMAEQCQALLLRLMELEQRLGPPLPAAEPEGASPLFSPDNDLDALLEAAAGRDADPSPAPRGDGPSLDLKLD